MIAARTLCCGEDISRRLARRRASTFRSMAELHSLRVYGSTMRSLVPLSESAWHLFSSFFVFSDLPVARRTTGTSFKRRTTRSFSPKALSFPTQTTSSPSFKTTPGSTRPTMETTMATRPRAPEVSVVSSWTLVPHSETGKSKAKSAATATSLTRLAGS
jgi:hypothetical protein